MVDSVRAKTSGASAAMMPRASICSVRLPEAPWPCASASAGTKRMSSPSITISGRPSGASSRQSKRTSRSGWWSTSRTRLTTVGVRGASRRMRSTDIGA